MVTRLKIKKGDTVKLRHGRDRGKQGKVLRLWPQTGRVLVEGLNLVQKTMRAKRQGEKNSRLMVAAPVAISAVGLVCPSCQKMTRVTLTRVDGRRQRQCKQCQAILSA